MIRIAYYEKIQKYCISPFRNIIGFKEALQAIAELFLQLQNKAYELVNWSIIDKAEGELLDYIGYLFGTYREYFDISKYFCANADDVNRSKYFFFENATIDSSVPKGSLSDQDLRQRIKGRIGILYSKFTRENNIEIIKNLTLSTHVYITKVDTMTLDINLVGDNVFITDNTFAEIESVLGDGVSLNNLTINGE